MTEVTRRVRRKTASSAVSRGRRKAIIIEIAPPGTLISFRLAGERRRYSLAVADLYPLAVRAESLARKQAKADARRARKAGRS